MEAQVEGASGRPLVLVVDDEAMIRNVFRRVLVGEGFDVVEAADGNLARELLSTQRFDVILTDISMPGLDGIGVLRTVREVDLDVPVILITGAPDYESVLEAMNHGAMRYLVKPVALEELVELVKSAESMHRLARIERRSLELLDAPKAHLAADRAGLEVSFRRALNKIWMAFQPVVDWHAREVFGYEALMRCDDPVLNGPEPLLAAAERLGELEHLGQLVRRKVAAAIEALPSGPLVFVNLHPVELADPELHDPDSPLSAHANRVVLEITERAKLGPDEIVARHVSSIRELGFKIAIDDLGAGYSGLQSYVQLAPDIIKLDGALVRGVATDPRRREVALALVDLAGKMGNRVIFEGVETQAELSTLVELGGELLQGYALARPGRPFPEIDPAVWLTS